MFKIILQRKKEYTNIVKNNKNSEGSTVGELIIYDEENKPVFDCFTLENEGASTDTPGKDKRIVARQYKLEWTTTTVSIPKKYKINSKMGKGLLLTCDKLPEFRKRRILIHIGNYPQDTEGCILLGIKDNNNGTISQSTLATEEFYNFVLEHNVNNFILDIREIET